MSEPAYVEWLLDLELFYVEPGIEGQVFQLAERDGIAVEIQFPTPEQNYSAVARGTDEHPEIMSVRELWLRARLLDGLDGVGTFTGDPADPPPEEQTITTEALRHAISVASVIVPVLIDMAAERSKRYLARLRTPFEDHRPKLWVGDPPRTAKASLPIEFTLWTPAPGAVLSAADLGAIRTALSSGEKPDLAWQLYGRASRLHALDKDLRWAILEAVIAVEVAIDAAYQRKAKAAGTTEVVTLLLKRMRDLRSQLKVGAEAILGTSYYTVDQVGYQRIIELEDRRNDIVHNGADPGVSAVQLGTMLFAVRALLEWLQSV